MPYTYLETQSPEEMTDILNGVIFSQKPMKATYDGTKDNALQLGGLTLVFTTPLVTVTFSADPTTIPDVAAELNTAVQAVDATFLAKIVPSHEAPKTVNPLKYLLKMQTDATAGMVINLTASTAANVLGFPTSGTLSRAPIDKTKIVGQGDRISGSLYLLIAP